MKSLIENDKSFLKFETEMKISSLQELEELVHEYPDFLQDQIRFFNHNGFLIFEDDFEFLPTNSLIYICGESFSFSQYMKEFAILLELGHGSFGRVFLGK